MKKTLFIFFILLFSAVPSFSAQSVEDVYNELLNMDKSFFESAVVPEVKVKTNISETQVNEVEKYTKHMPLFKKTRVRIQNALKTRDIKAEEKRALRSAQKEKRNSDKDYLKDLDLKYVEFEDEPEVEVSNKTDSEQKTELVGGVKEQVTEKEMMLDCDIVKTDEKTGEVEAIGNPVLILPSQKVKLTADKMVYNRDANILKAIGNVVLTKDGMPVYGDYIQINMNEENILMDNIIASPTAMQIKAKKAYSENDKLILSEGSMFSEKSNKFNFISRMIGPDFSKMIISEEDRSSFVSGDTAKLRIAASDVEVKAGKGHDIFQVKDAELYYNDKYLFSLPSFTAYTNKDREYFEANYPEFGSRSRFGMFAGPGVVVGGPFGSTLKLIPLVNYKSGDLGIGGAVKFKSAFNDTQLMYGSGADIFVLQGRQQLDENLFLQYGSNAYMDEWFMGRRMPKYLAEIVYDKGKTINNFLAEGKDLRFKHRASMAYAQDGEWNMHTEHLQSTGIGTSRFRYMAEIDQSLYKYRDELNRKAVELSFVMQGSAAVYGTGDTQFIGRVGPRLHTQYKYWMQDIGYFASGYSDHTPMPVYDMYRYGHSNVYIREALRINRYLTVGWSGSITVTNDSPNGKMFQENAFIFSLGPDDFKVNLGYDFMRRTTYFTVAVAFDTKNTTIDFDKMEIKNPERLGQSNSKDDSIAFKQNSGTITSKKLQYAEVIDLEDPDKESI